MGARNYTIVVAAFMSLTLTACATLAHSAPVTRQLQMISAGHTGCLPEDNKLSNVNMNLDGSGTWNATCKGRVYLCSSAAGQGESFSCAPLAH